MKYTNKTVCGLAATLITFGSLAGEAHAAVTLIGLGSFPGSEAVIGFDALIVGQSVTTQFAGLGVEFGGSGSFVRAYSDFGPGLVAEASSIGLGSQALNHSLNEVSFTNPVAKVGFYFGSNVSVNVPFQTFRDGTQTGTFNLVVSPNEMQFFGFEDLEGIDRLEFDQELNSRFVSMIDDFRFVSVPEPSSSLLLGLGALGFLARRKRTA